MYHPIFAGGPSGSLSLAPRGSDLPDQRARESPSLLPYRVRQPAKFNGLIAGGGTFYRRSCSIPQMRHHLGGEEIHVSSREIIRKDAKLEEGH